MGLFKEKEDHYYMSWSPSRRINMHEDVLKEFFKICKEIGMPLAKEPFISTEYMYNASFNLMSGEWGSVMLVNGSVIFQIYRKTKTGCSEDKIDSIFYETIQRIIYRSDESAAIIVLKNNYRWYEFFNQHTEKHTYMD